MTDRPAVPAAQALALVPREGTVFLGSGCGEPQTLVEALIAGRDRFSKLRLVTGLQGSKAPYAAPEFQDHFRLCSFVSSRGIREAVREGRADYLPVPLSRIPGLFRDRTIALDVAMVQVSPPDAEGYCSLGVSVGYAKAAVESAGTVIAEVNARMPRTLGDCRVHLDDIDAIVESNRPVLEVPASKLNDELTAIGRNVASLVKDRATVQVGVGAIAEAVWLALKDHRDIGIHSGSLPDAVIDMIERGVVTNSYKSIDAGRIVTGQLIATARLYDYAHENPIFDMRPCDYTHDPATLARIAGLVSVNSGVQVDLRGQVNAESVNGYQISGVGGAIDFTMGAVMAPGGRSVVALPSTARGGTESRIVPLLDQGVVTSPCSLVDHVVTEHGIADLRGRSLRERARALIAVAAPQFREGLERGLRGEASHAG